jgi:hypothetical protein
MIGSVRPPLIVLKPFPLVVPCELAESFVAAVEALDQSRTDVEIQARQQRPADRVEIETVLQILKAGFQAPAGRR